MKSRLRRYFFTLAVATYVLTALGLPVFLHYCGGEVEEISYLVKASSCCGDEAAEDNGCCRDEGLVLQYDADFTLKTFSSDMVKAVTELLFIPSDKSFFNSENEARPFRQADPPFAWQHSLLSEITVLRI